MKRLESIVDSAETILIPSGRDSSPAIKAFQEKFAIEVPTRADGDRRLQVQSEGRRFVWVKGKDVPSLVDGGFADIGLTDTDVGEAYAIETASGMDDELVRFAPIGDSMATFELMAPEAIAKEVAMRLETRSREYGVTVATSLPTLLAKYAFELGLNTRPTDFMPRGSVETMPQLGVSEAVADIVETEKTMRANGLIKVRKLADIKPAVWFGRVGYETGE